MKENIIFVKAKSLFNLYTYHNHSLMFLFEDGSE